VLPSEGQRKKLKHQTSKDLSFMSEDGFPPSEEPGKESDLKEKPLMAMMM
jgi:hypothetical protein